MGIIKFGGGVAGISGKIGGTVFARNKAGAYARNWAKPTNTPTPKQTANRARFGTQSTGWAALTQAQRDAWQGMASGMTRLNRFGEAYTPTGRQIYLESSNNLAIIGLAPLTDPPLSNVTPNPVDPFSLTLEVASGSAWSTFSITGLAVTATYTFVIDATPPFSDGKTNYTNLFRQILTIPSAATVNAMAGYTAVFGTVAPEDSQVAVRIKVVDEISGFASTVVIVVGTVVQT